MLEIRLLGKFEIQLDDQPVEISSRPARLLLAYLVLTKGVQHPREKLAGVMWPDSSEANARKNLRQALWHLRKAIGDSHLLADASSLGFNLDSDHWLDISQLEDTADQNLEAEVSVYAGELLPGFYEDWILLERDRLAAAFERKMQLLMDQLVREQRWVESIEWAERWIAQGQVPEPAYRALLIAHAAMGDVPKVEAVFRRCVDALRHQIGVEPSKETQDLFKSLIAAGGIPEELDTDRSGEGGPATTRRIALPAPPTPFIGRLKELADVEQSIRDTRLLSLIGPGGIGKTRLAIKAAEGAAGEMKHGCFFVSLVPVSSTDTLIQRIAEVLGFPLATHEDPKHQLLRSLRDKQLLLLLDNFEHLLEAVSLVSEILQAAPGVKILATSHEKLNLQGEAVVYVSGMTIPDRADPETTRSYDAIDLFVHSAGRVRPDFAPTPEELAQITQICQAVGGMPLAIELAAAWLAILSVDEVAAELRKGLDILTSDARDAPERHRSIRAVVDHSWSLLDQKQQEVFLRLSIFQGGFTRQAAQQVAGASLRQLAELVHKSLLTHHPDSARFAIHQLLRQYAHEQYESMPEVTSSGQESHAAYFADFMDRRGSQLRDVGQIRVLEEIEADLDNVRSAWRYYLDQGETTQLWKFTTSLWHVYWHRWWNHAGWELFAEAVDALCDRSDEDAVTLRAHAMGLQSYFMGWLGLADEGYQLAGKSVEILKQKDHPEALVISYYSLIVNAYFLGQMAGEYEPANEMLQITSELGDAWLTGFALFAGAMASLMVEKYDEAETRAKSCLDHFERCGDRSSSTMPLITLGHIALARGDHETARAHYLRCFEIADEVGFYYSIQTATKYLSKVAQAMNKNAEANQHLLRSLRITKEIGWVRDVINLLYEFSRLRAAEGKLEEAAELLALVIEHPASQQTRWLEGAIRGSAEELLAKVQAGLSPEKFSAAIERGRKLNYDDVTASLLAASDN
jgi:predicted ATPase/DNA-binding SARP family transcriptional activator